MVYKTGPRQVLRRMLKEPSLKSSGLCISVFQDRHDKGAFNMFENIFFKRSIFSYFCQTSGTSFEDNLSNKPCTGHDQVFNIF